MPAPFNTAKRLPPGTLTVHDHDRDSAGLTYVYPVISRRAGGVSIGVNLNVNNACNWRCIYCQVPELARGAPPPVDLQRLRSELEGFLREALEGDFLVKRVPPEARRLNDIAVSGNGEPTSAREFADVIEIIGAVRQARGVPSMVKTILITNGSLVQRPGVQRGLRALAAMNGEVWFKLDRATETGMRKVNDTRTTMSRVRRNLAIAAGQCRTWVQTCLFALDGAPPGEEEQQAYVDFLADCVADGIPLAGVLLYGLARAPLQPEAPRLSVLSAGWMEAFAQRVRALGLTVSLTP